MPLTHAARLRNYRWKNLPYGRWTCPNGRQVLFDRRYHPMWQRQPNGSVTPADPAERISFIHEEWFYEDATPELDKHRNALAALSAWGIPKPKSRPRKKILGEIQPGG